MDIARRSDASSRISLADEPDFMVGSLIVRPSVRQIVAGGKSETLEPKVMQVLVALGRAHGDVVSRDALVALCWGGRAIGEDAINRAIAKLRRSAEAEGSFRIETIPRVGFRLVEAGSAGIAEFPKEPAPAAPMPPRTSRRLFLATAAAATAAAFAGVAIWRRQEGAEPPPAEVIPLMQQAQIALGQDTREGHNQAIGLLQRVVAIAPDYADGWGALGNAYATTASARPLGESDTMRARALSAGRRALALDPGNGFGQVALAMAVPLRGNWLNIERALRHALSQHEDDQQLAFALVTVLTSVGRDREALTLVQRMAGVSPPQPHVYYCYSRLLWAANRLDEADRVLAEAASIYPTHFAIWFVRFYLLMYSGRAGAAIALAQDLGSRPSGIPEAEIASVLRVAQAIQSQSPGAISSVLAEYVALAHQGAGQAENAVLFACAVGRIDEAFALVEAYYFGRGFVVPDVRFSQVQGTYTPQRERLTNFLFVPPAMPLHADPRFERLVAEIGLDNYWREAGISPDYRSPAALRARMEA